MEIKIFTFPSLSGDLFVVEKAYNELNSKYRRGEELDPEAIDWMDSANIVLMTSDSVLN